MAAVAKVCLNTLPVQTKWPLRPFESLPAPLAFCNRQDLWMICRQVGSCSSGFSKHRRDCLANLSQSRQGLRGQTCCFASLRHDLLLLSILLSLDFLSLPFLLLLFLFLGVLLSFLCCPFAGSFIICQVWWLDWRWTLRKTDQLNAWCCFEKDYQKQNTIFQNTIFDFGKIERQVKNPTWQSRLFCIRFIQQVHHHVIGNRKRALVSSFVWKCLSLAHGFLCPEDCLFHGSSQFRKKVRPTLQRFGPQLGSLMLKRSWQHLTLFLKDTEGFVGSSCFLLWLADVDLGHLFDQQISHPVIAKDTWLLLDGCDEKGLLGLLI